MGGFLCLLLKVRHFIPLVLKGRNSSPCGTSETCPPQSQVQQSQERGGMQAAVVSVARVLEGSNRSAAFPAGPLRLKSSICNTCLLCRQTIYWRSGLWQVCALSCCRTRCSLQKKQLHTLSVTGASFECFPLSCLESLSTKGTSSTPSNIILFREIHAFQRSSLTFDVTVLFVARNALSAVEGLFCTRDCVVLVGVCTVLSLNSNRVKCLWSTRGVF